MNFKIEKEKNVFAPEDLNNELLYPPAPIIPPLGEEVYFLPSTSPGRLGLSQENDS